MEYIFKNLGNIFKDLVFKPIELPTFWEANPSVRDQVKTHQIIPEPTVRLYDGKLMDVSDGLPPTHKVVSCIRTTSNEFELTMMSLTDEQPLTITLA